eukprot:3248318-Rhodomonas_salina.1
MPYSPFGFQSRPDPIDRSMLDGLREWELATGGGSGRLTLFRVVRPSSVDFRKAWRDPLSA